jgi:hypothetical protein
VVSFVGYESRIRDLKELLRNRRIRWQLGAQAPAELLAEVGDLHAGHHDKFARKHFARFVVIGKLAGDAAILAILIPAETAVRNRLRTDELKTTEERVALRDLEFFAEEGDLHEFFVGTKWFRHLGRFLCKRCGEFPRGGTRVAISE